MNTTTVERSSDELQAELKVLQARRPQLAGEVDEAQEELAAARTALVDGTGKSSALVAAHVGIAKMLFLAHVSSDFTQT